MSDTKLSMSSVSSDRSDSNAVRSNGNQAHLTLQEIAQAMNLTRERVRQIEAKALNKLRKKMLSQGLKLSDFLGD